MKTYVHLTFWRRNYFFNFSTRLCGLVVRVSGYRYRGLGFDSLGYQIFWVVVGLERGPIRLLRSIEELLEWKSSRSVEIRCADHVTTLYPQKLALTSPTGGGRSVGIVRSRTKATEFSFYVYVNICVCVNVCVYMLMYVYMCTCMCICVCCMYVYECV
jgi:hypothetical protein